MKKPAFTYKSPDSRGSMFGGTVRNEDGDLVQTDASESKMSPAVLGSQANFLPVDHVVITELSDLFEQSVSLCYFCLNCLL